MTEVNPLLVPLIEKRKALGMPQRQLAERVRRCPEQVNKWEKGVNEPCLRNLQNWCEAVGLKLTITEETK